ncbi:hypothetical protein QYM36_000414, partial [Artemia franciscana]
RTSYEWCIPKGILKSTWLQKHVHQIPAVVVCFADLDWNDPAWPEKKAEVIEKVQQLKSIIGTRRCKVALVLIQRGIPLPPGEDPLAAERAGILCQACDIPAKYLLALPSHADHLHGYTRRLESAFLDMAQNYYLGEARRVKSHREQLNKINHAYLYVRHSFKIAVYCELRQDQSNALKHYTQAYENLLQVRISDNNLNEIKSVAIIIAYKIWRINFLQNQPRESINHFKNHIDHFRGIAGHKELEFEQQAWLAQQYEIFAMLFEEAVAAGLSATQKEHPGFYFQQAGLHAQLRKKLSKESLESGIRPADEAPLNTPTGFYGQRPWRREKISMEPAAPAIESEEISYLKLVESKYEHCDFGDVIPGHGGIMDRFDCQYLMATFVKVYISSFIRSPSPQHFYSQESTVSRRAKGNEEVEEVGCQEISSDSEVEHADHNNAGLTHQGLDVIDQVEDALENIEEHISDVVNSPENDDEVESEVKTAIETEDEESEAKKEDLGADDIEDEPLKAVGAVESSVDEHEEVSGVKKSEDETVVIVLPPETRVEEQEIEQPYVMKDEKKILTTTMKNLLVLPAGSPQKTADPGVHSLLPSKQRS